MQPNPAHRETSHTVDAGRLTADIRHTAGFGGTVGGGIDRLALSGNDRLIREWFAKECQAAGCALKIDQMGNMFAIRPGLDPDRLPIAMGSHLDTQSPGGRYDGVLGVLAGLEVVRTLNDLNLQTRAPLAIVNWTNEEGARFSPAMVGSGVYAGVYAAEFAKGLMDRDGQTLGACLDEIGFVGTEAVGAPKFASYFELHIEQGPVLEASDTIIGVVQGVQAMRCLALTVSGLAGHAGTTPMPYRRDAMRGAAAMVTEAFEIAALAGGLATCGTITIDHPSRNVVPGSVKFTLDLRHVENEQLDGIENGVRVAADRICMEYKLEFAIEREWHSPAVAFDPVCVGVVQTAADSLGYRSAPIVSGAGHDAVHLAPIVPTTMIFVPSRDGISHNEAEFTTADDCVAGANVLLNAVLAYDNLNDGASGSASHNGKR